MNKRIKYILVAIIISATSISSYAQTSNAIYFLENNAVRHELNPAFATEKGYFSIPIIGNLSFGNRSNIALSDIIYPTNNNLTTFLDRSISAEDAMSKFKNRNNINLNFEVPIISFGFNKWGGFNTFGITAKASAFANLPYDLFEMAKLGMDNVDNSFYDMSSLSASGYGFAEIAFGHSREIIPNLRVGAKFNLLLGLMNATSQVNNCNVFLSQDVWRVVTDASIQTTGLPLTYGSDGSVDGVGDPKIGINGAGFTIDLGASYELSDQLTISASVTDLGFISWSDKNSSFAKTNGRTLIFDGFEELSLGANEIEDQVDALQSDLEGIVSFYEMKSGFKSCSSLPTKLIFGGEYTLEGDWVSFGLLSTTSIKKNQTWTDTMVSANLSPAKWVTFGLNYSVSNLGTGYGAVINLSGASQNVFIAANSMSYKFTPQGAPIGNSSLGFNIGWSVMFGK